MDVSKQNGNPANGLKEQYQELMTIKDADTFYATVFKLMASYHGHGLSTKNWLRFQRNIRHIKTDLVQMQGLVTNFLLKADGDGVIYTG